MKDRSQAKLISYNIDNVEICASAARISTTKGNAIEIFEKARKNEKNQELVQKVLSSGHKSIIEHVVFTFALNDVSAFVEQFFIECRLASFTVKSRRYVDFSESGYHIPADLEREDLRLYCSYMDNLFLGYNHLLENDIPKEDARFLLPYSFHSNFYCTINARELSNMIHNIRCGSGRGIPELQDIADQMIQQAKSVFPCITDLVDEMPHNKEDHNGSSDNTITYNDTITLIDSSEIGAVRLLNQPSDPLTLLHTAYDITHSNTDPAFAPGMIPDAVRPRELEQLSYTFLIANITLSGITHIVRHRMQSIIIPSIQGIEHSNFIIPDKIKDDPRSSTIYKSVLETSNTMLKQMNENEKLRRYNYYYALSGNVMDIITTINARELMHFIKLRACNRAQWEIRNISIDMLKLLRGTFPELFHQFGPSCFVTGTCPEGKMSCGRMSEVKNYFTQL